MVLVSKAAWAGMVFLLLTTGASGPRRALLLSGANLSQGVPTPVSRNDVKKTQEILRNKGHYRGQVDGIFGLRTGASIRAYQKAENLPVTGGLDAKTAGKLGVTPEVREAPGDGSAKGKPAAGIKYAKGSERNRNLQRKVVKTCATPETGRVDPKNALQAGTDNQ